MKLIKQCEILKLLNEGWELYFHLYRDSPFWIQKGSYMQLDCHAGSVRSLEQTNKIRCAPKEMYDSINLTRYELIK